MAFVRGEDTISQNMLKRVSFSVKRKTVVSQQSVSDSAPHQIDIPAGTVIPSSCEVSVLFEHSTSPWSAVITFSRHSTVSHIKRVSYPDHGGGQSFADTDYSIPSAAPAGDNPKNL